MVWTVTIRRIAVENYQLALLVAGGWLMVRGIGEWSRPLADVFLGGALVAVALVPYVLRGLARRRFERGNA